MFPHVPIVMNFQMLRLLYPVATFQKQIDIVGFESYIKAANAICDNFSRIF